MQPDEHIKMGGAMMTPSILLHEWIHAIDYHVGNKIIPGQFASEINETVAMQNSKEYQAFRAIKDLTQDIFSKDPDVVQRIKANLLKEGTSKFLSNLTGPEFYLVSPYDKGQLESQHATICVNNYLSNHTNIDAQDDLVRLLKRTALCTDDVESKIRNPNISTDIKPIKKYFDQVNENTLGKKSFYQFTSNVSRFGFRLFLLMQDIVQNGFFINDDKKLTLPGNMANEHYLSEPKEMVARYFESQVFRKDALQNSVFWAKRGVVLYKLTTDENFEQHTQNILTNVLGYDKVAQTQASSETSLNPIFAPELNKIGKKIAELRQISDKVQKKINQPAIRKP